MPATLRKLVSECGLISAKVIMVNAVNELALPKARSGLDRCQLWRLDIWAEQLSSPNVLKICDGRFAEVKSAADCRKKFWDLANDAEPAAAMVLVC